MSARTPSLLALSLVVWAPVSACAGDPPARDPSQWPISRVEIERAIPSDDPGERTYRAHCIACHGVDGRGAGNTTGANFTAPDGVLTEPDERLLARILDGERGPIGVMPAHRDVLGEERSREVLAYIRRRFGAGIEVRDAGIVDDAGDAGPLGMMDDDDRVVDESPR
jgi:mono/diheme cytochrome c family protein